MRTDEEILRGLMIEGLNGDEDAHARLLSLLVPRLRSYYQRRMHGADADVEDMIQDTLIAVHTRRATYDRSRTFTAWLFAVARYKMVDHFRRIGRLPHTKGFEEMLAVEEFETSLIAKLDIEELLSGLPPKQARMIHATRIQGLSVAEAALADGIGESDVKISVHRGLKTLVARVHEGSDES